MPVRTPRLLAAVLAAGLTVGLAACAQPAADETPATVGANPADPAVFPVTVEHAFGTTNIAEKPERIATVAWSNHEVPLALGVVPVGMAAVTWGDDDGDGVLPWVEDKLQELGAETPVLFDESDGPDYEAIADTRPDVILASYSGLTQEQYDRLSGIAPVVAYPEIPWGTSVGDMVTMNATALGLAAEGEALNTQLRADADAALEKYSVLKDKKVLFTSIVPADLSQITYYTAADTRPGYLRDLGLPLPALVEENADSTQFFLTLSAEEADRLNDVDLIITYGDESVVALMQADPLLSKIPAVAEGRIAVLGDSTPLAASANPSPLSIPWGVDAYFAALAQPFGE